MTSRLIGKALNRRAVLAGGAAALSMPFIIKSSYADAKPFRISLPGNEEEWQAKNLQAFKAALDKSSPGQFDVQIHYNGTLFGQGTEIEAMQRGNLEVGMVSPQDIAALIPEYSVFTTGYLMRDPAHLDAVYDGDIGAEYKAKIEKDVGITLVKSQYLGTRHVILREVEGGRQAGRPGGPEAAHARLGSLAVPRQFARRQCDAAGVRGGVSGDADRHHRRAGEPAARRDGGQVLRGRQADRADLAHGRQHLLRGGERVSGMP